MLSIRLVKDEDRAAIDQLIRGAFVSPGASVDSVQEAPLVATLRANGDVLLEQVLVDQTGAISAHVAVSRVSLLPDEGLLAGQVAPLSVSPDSQGMGHGSTLMRAMADSAKELGIDVLFVLGDPSYYDRLGFKSCSVNSAYGPSEYYRAKFLQGEPQDLSHCEARLAPAFAALDE